MRIAICNRNRRYLDSLKLMLYRYAEKKRLEIAVECYYCGKDMLATKNRYNIVFLEYDAYSVNGLETAKTLRESDCFCSIIFIGNKNRFCNSIFKVSPSGFLTYPIDESEVVSVLDDCFRKKINGYPLLIKSSEDTVCLNSNEIFYIEANNKHCIISLGKKCINCNQTMGKLYEQLPKMVFLKINRANVINSEYINSFNAGEVTLKNGKKLYISRNYRKNFKENYCEFINTIRL